MTTETPTVAETLDSIDTLCELCTSAGRYQHTLAVVVAGLPALRAAVQAAAQPPAPTDWRNWHGHVRPRPDGRKARCGGPGLCAHCRAEQDALSSTPQPAQAQQPAGGVPEGWKLVPVDPTAAMAEAGAGVDLEDGYDDPIGTQSACDEAAATYRAMVAASPTPPAAAVGWRPISEAPRDGRPVDLWGRLEWEAMKPIALAPERRFADCRFRQMADGPHFDAQWLTADGKPVSATHWHPSPAPPSGSGA